MSITKVTYSLIQGAPINVQDYGAVGNGIADDTNAILLALNSLVNNSSLIFPAGTYLINSSLSKTLNNLNNIQIIGLSATILINIDQTSGQYLLNLTNCSNININGLVINGNAYILNFAYWSNCSFVNISNCTFQNFWRTAPTVDGFVSFASACQEFNFSNNLFSRVNRCIVFDDDSTISYNVNISNNNFWQVGFTCVTAAHNNCTIVGNTMKYASLGPYPENVGATRTNMRNPSWTPTLTTSSYGGGHGPAINSGSALNGCVVTGMVISDNVIDQVAEYAIGIEGALYYNTNIFGGPCLNIVISNNTISNTGVDAILLSGCNGVQVIGNTIENAGLSQAGNSFVSVSCRTVDPSFSGQPLANKQENGCYNITIVGNNFRDTLQNVPTGIFISPSNVQQSIGDIVISNNNFEMDKASCNGVYVYTNSGANYLLYKINITNNNFGMSANSGSAYINWNNNVPTNCAINNNRVNGFSDLYALNGITFADSIVGSSEALTGTASSNFTVGNHPSGTVQVINSQALTSYGGTASLISFTTGNANGPSNGYFGYSGAGTGGNYLAGTFYMGTVSNSAGTAWSSNYLWTTSYYIPGTDNTQSLGTSGSRWSVVYAGTGTINTSDANQKQQLASLNSAELATAKAIKNIFKTYKFNDAVAKKGEEARIHIGVSAQDVQATFTANGLDATKYGLFCSDTWYTVNGKSHDDNENPYTSTTPNAVAVTQLGVRYDELLAFIISAL